MFENKLSVAPLLFLGLALAMTPARAVEIKVIASNAVKEAYVELVPQFEKASGSTVSIDWGGTADIVKRLEAGEAADLVIIPSFTVDTLIADRKLAAGSRVDLVKSIIGVAVRPGAPRPDLSSGDGLRASLLAAKSIVLSGGPSGGYMASLFEKMGIADQIRAKLIRIPVGKPVGETLARGEGDLGFTQVSEFLHIQGIDYRGPLPADIQSVTVFSSAVPNNAGSRDAAADLVTFLTSPTVLPVLKKNGLEPG
jgi:molybdate transport system substrate-binding protein